MKISPCPPTSLRIGLQWMRLRPSQANFPPRLPVPWRPASHVQRHPVVPSLRLSNQSVSTRWGSLVPVNCRRMHPGCQTSDVDRGTSAHRQTMQVQLEGGVIEHSRGHRRLLRRCSSNHTLENDSGTPETFAASRASPWLLRARIFVSKVDPLSGHAFKSTSQPAALRQAPEGPWNARQTCVGERRDESAL